MPRIITPSDWAIVGRSFDAVVEARADEAALELRVVTLEDVNSSGIAAPPIHRVTQDPASTPVLRRFSVPALPGDGKYVLMVGPAGNFAANVIVSGIQVIHEQAWTADRMRLPDLGAEGDAPLFSIITTVYDIDPGMLEETVASVLAQEMRDFEWLVLDNGSRLPATVAAVAALGARDPRVRTFRVENNIHIVRGNRYVLDRARGEYVLPIDADDLLYPEALEWLARGIRSHRGIAMVFADEEKVDVFGRPISPLHRESWSRIASMGTVPAAHPTAFRRDLALQCDVYTDERTLGSHDWDTALRLADHNQRALHVPAILYGWRMHSASTSLDGGAKSYVVNSQRAVVDACLERRRMQDLFEVRDTDAGLGYFHLARRPVRPAEVFLLVLVRSAAAATLENAAGILRGTDYPLRGIIVAGLEGTLPASAQDALQAIAAEKGLPAPVFRELASLASLEALRDAPWLEGPAGHVAIVDAALRPANPAWLWDAVGALDLDGEVGAVGGYIFDPAGNVLHFGLVAGLADDAVTPFYGRPPAPAVRHLAIRHRAVSGVHCGFALVRDALVRQIGLPKAADWDAVASDPAWTFAALQWGCISAIAPAMVATRQASFASQGRVDVPRLPTRYPELRGVDPYYAWYLSPRSDNWGQVGR
ncbi:MAG TPA: glycosyltransferase [Usitatibacter sp.]|nr:glycosyltransferase [Usitatibacter sp.]